MQQDTISLISFGAAFDTFAEVLAASADSGGDTIITLNEQTLVLEGVLRATLSQDDFIFG